MRIRKKIPSSRKKNGCAARHRPALRLLAYLHGVEDGAPLGGGETRLEERSDSALSLASTIAFDAAPTEPRVIKAFCPFNQLLVTIPFPNENDG